MLNMLNLRNNNILFIILVALTPILFSAMLVGSQSLIAAFAVAVAYICVLVGERID